MKILVSGSTGLIGSALVSDLRTKGHSVTPLVRPERRGAGGVLWDVESARFDASAAEGTDAVVHLAGENIGARRWSEAQKREIRDSRVRGTRFLAERLAALSSRPRVLVAASAVGFYGDTGEGEVDEGSPPGEGFLAEVCREWERAPDPLRERGVRVVSLRFGVVLSPQGGALKQMLPIFRLGLGGRVGSGRQWMSWVSLPEVVRIVGVALEDDRLSGAVNAVAPAPVRNADFAAALGRVLRRPALFPAPAFALRLALGEMADALLLASTRVLPKALAAQSYRFAHPEVEAALRSLLG